MICDWCCKAMIKRNSRYSYQYNMKVCSDCWTDLELEPLRITLEEVL